MFDKFDPIFHTRSLAEIFETQGLEEPAKHLRGEIRKKQATRGSLHLETKLLLLLQSRLRERQE